MTIDRQVRAFLAVLSSGWHEVETLARETGVAELISDWAQANWEMLVEFDAATPGELNLEVYGEGADCRARSSRVSRPAALPNAAVVCLARSATQGLVDVLTGAPVEAGLKVDQFCSVRDGWISQQPPFDHAVLNIGPVQVVPVADVQFSLARY